MTDERPVILHVGAHKTASSLLQRALLDDDAKLRRKGLAVVHRKTIVKSDFFTALKRVVITGRVPGKVGTQAARASFSSLINHPQSATLLTNEDFLEVFRQPRFYRNIAKALPWLQTLTDRPLSLILYTRNQPDYVESMYMQRIHLGDSESFEDVRGIYDSLDLSWARVLDNASAVLGKENIVAIPYESVKRIGSAGYYQTFLRSCGIDDASLAISEDLETSRSANRSYSGEAMKLALAINPLLEPENRIILRKFLQENYSTATHPRAVLFNTATRKDLLDRYRGENERLFSTYMPTWRPDSELYDVPFGSKEPEDYGRVS